MGNDSVRWRPRSRQMGNVGSSKPRHSLKTPTPSAPVKEIGMVSPDSTGVPRFHPGVPTATAADRPTQEARDSPKGQRQGEHQGREIGNCPRFPTVSQMPRRPTLHAVGTRRSSLRGRKCQTSSHVSCGEAAACYNWDTASLDRLQDSRQSEMQAWSSSTPLHLQVASKEANDHESIQ